MQCDSRHKLVRYARGNKRGPNDANGRPTIAAVEAKKCANCKKAIPSDKSFASCLQACEFFLCAKCSECPCCTKVLNVNIAKAEAFVSRWIENCQHCENRIWLTNAPKNQFLLAPHLQCYSCKPEVNKKVTVCRKCVVPYGFR